jgi:mannose-6-phosphate isomerase-like protein (cupin superfamily)
MTFDFGSAQILGPRDGDYAGKPGVLHDRFLVNHDDTGGHFALVEHLLPGRTLAAPVHRHQKEDEYSFVLEGTVGALLGEQEVVATAGTLIFKPRGQWHTFWNAGDTPARILEIISPGGFEQAFRDLDELGGELTPEALSVIGKQYAVEIDFEATGSVAERHGLSM